MHAGAWISVHGMQSREIGALTVEIECEHIRIIMLDLLAHALRFTPEYVDAGRHYRINTRTMSMHHENIIESWIPIIAVAM